MMIPEIARSLNSQRDGYNDGSDQTYIPALTRKMAKGTGGPAGDECQNLVAAPLSHGSNPNSNMAGRRREDDENLVRAFSIYPEAGQGADLRATETDHAPSISGVDGARQSERGLRLVVPALTAANDPSRSPQSSEITQQVAAILPVAGVRRLTPTECERLQALPDGWTAPTGTEPDSRRYAALGDAVTSSVAEWIGRRLLEKEEAL